MDRVRKLSESALACENLFKKKTSKLANLWEKGNILLRMKKLASHYWRMM